MKKLIAIKTRSETNKYLHINWFLHNKCNYHCSYCPSINHDGSQLPSSYSQIVSFLEKVFIHYSHKNTIHFSFTGGEPTLWPEFIPLCQFLHSHKCHIGMTSNGSLAPDSWEKISPYFNWICLSFHPEKALLGNFLSVIQAIKASNHSIVLTVRLMMPPQKQLWEKSSQLGEMIKTSQEIDWLRVEYVPLQKILGSTSGEMMSYSNSQLDFLRQNPIFEKFNLDKKPMHFRPPVDLWGYNECYSDQSTVPLNSNQLIINDMNHFKGWICHCGMDLLFIDHLQNIYRATCHEGGRIGNVADSHIQFPSTPTICTNNSCACEADLQCPKYMQNN